MDSTYKIIASYDTAIDFVRASKPDASGKTPLVEYINTREVSVIEPFFIAAEKPTVFYARRLSRAVVRKIAKYAVNEYANHELAFQYGVVAVDDHVDDDGREIPSWKPSGIVDNEPFVSEEELNLFSVAQINEIGAVIYQMSFLERRMRATLRLPRTSRELLAQIMVP